MKKPNRNIQKEKELKYLSQVLLAFIAIPSAFCPVLAADFVQNANCGLTNPAFTETFNAPSPGGIGGDIDESKWDVSRGGLAFDEPGAAGWVDRVILPPCRQGAPASAYPDSELIVCDNTNPAMAGKLMVPNGTPFYNMTAMRCLKPFDFANRTGTIAFDVDARSSFPTGHWITMSLVEDPNPTPNVFLEHQGIPRSGIQLFSATVDASGNTTFGGAKWVNMAQSDIWSSNQATFAASAGHMNHFEIKVSQNRLEVWASDFSADGITFPNFRMISYADNMNLSFTRGYVVFGTHNHATEKYESYPTAYHYWDNLGFDGPSLPNDRYYRVPNSRTLYTNNNGEHMNLGYIVKNSANGDVPSVYTNLTGPLPAFVLKNVDLTNATGACVSTYAAYFYINSPALEALNLRYRLNGGAWSNHLLSAAELAILKNPNPTHAAIQLVLPVALSDLKAGDNALDFSSINSSGNMVKITSVGLTVKTDGTATSTQKASHAGRPSKNISYSVDAGANRLAFRIKAASRGKTGADSYDITGKLIQARICN
jgi:hypothetical protein